MDAVPHDQLGLTHLPLAWPVLRDVKWPALVRMFNGLLRTAKRVPVSSHLRASTIAACHGNGLFQPRDANASAVIQSLANLAYSDNQLCQGLSTPKVPQLQRDGVPVVHHPMYSAPLLPPRHRFPMQVFQTIHDSLVDDDVIHPDQV